MHRLPPAYCLFKLPARAQTSLNLTKPTIPIRSDFTPSRPTLDDEILSRLAALAAKNLPGISTLRNTDDPIRERLLDRFQETRYLGQERTAKEIDSFKSVLAAESRLAEAFNKTNPTLKVQNWYEAVMQDSYPRKKNILDLLARAEVDNGNLNPLFSIGLFHEQRVEIALAALQGQGKILNFTRIYPGDYVDGLGIDFLVTFKDKDGKPKTLPLQICSSINGCHEKMRPRLKALVAQRKGLPETTRFKYDGIYIYSAGGKSITELANHLDGVINNPRQRAKFQLKLINPDKFNSMTRSQRWTLLESTYLKVMAA